ncbi:MAG: type II toxin-antitoxin system VapC family toxin [Planctomycetota bacterium]
MRYLLDTNICIYLINRRPASIRERFERVAVGDIAISAVTASELRYGAEKSARREQNLQALGKFLLPLPVLPYDAAAVEHYGRIRARLERAGTPIGGMDLMIAAHALALGAVLVTHNVSEFRRVPDLSVEDWIAPSPVAA